MIEVVFSPSERLSADELAKMLAVGSAFVEKRRRRARLDIVKILYGKSQMEVTEVIHHLTRLQEIYAELQANQKYQIQIPHPKTEIALEEAITALREKRDKGKRFIPIRVSKDTWNIQDTVTGLFMLRLDCIDEMSAQKIADQLENLSIQKKFLGQN